MKLTAVLKDSQGVQIKRMTIASRFHKTRFLHRFMNLAPARNGTITLTCHYKDDLKNEGVYTSLEDAVVAYRAFTEDSLVKTIERW